jgi:hypothetical protein
MKSRLLGAVCACVFSVATHLRKSILIHTDYACIEMTYRVGANLASKILTKLPPEPRSHCFV